MTVEAFLSECRTDSTRINYTTGICTFIHMVYSLPNIKGERRTKEERELCFKKCNEYIKEKRNNADDLINFIKMMSEKNLSPQLINVNITAVKEFLIHHRIKLDEFDLRRIKRIKPSISPVKRKYDISHEDIRKILKHSHETLRALILLLVTSGARIDEILSLRLKDVEIRGNYGVIYISRQNTKTKKQRYSFISEEAVAALNDYIRIKKKEKEDILFDFTYENANYMFNLALTRAELDERDEATNTRKITFHIFRAFFISQLKLVISPAIPEFLAGHEGYLDKNYRNYPQKQVLAEYLKGVKMLTFDMPDDVREIQDRTEKTLSEHSEVIARLVLEKHQLRAEIDEIHRQYQELLTGVSLIYQIHQYLPETSVAFRESLKMQEDDPEKAADYFVRAIRAAIAKRS